MLFFKPKLGPNTVTLRLAALRAVGPGVKFSGNRHSAILSFYLSQPGSSESMFENYWTRSIKTVLPASPSGKAKKTRS